MHTHGLPKWCVVVFVLAIMTLLSPPADADDLRQEIDLDGDVWEYAMVDKLDSPPENGWRDCTVPRVIRGVRYKRAWFRRDFRVPAGMRGRRIVLHFGGVKFNSVVRVNGQRVGGHFGGYQPFDVDITDVAKVGGTNRLELGCHDWTGVFIDRETDFSVLEGGRARARDVPEDKILAPIGGRHYDFGPWDDISLRAHPAVCVKDLFIKPSVQNDRLQIEYELENTTDARVTVTLQPRVLDDGEIALEIPGKEIEIPASETARLATEATWADARLWCPDDPYLYFLETTLRSDGEVVDRLRTRFGFREFGVEGKNFYLNGKRINLLASSWWPPHQPQTEEYVRERIRGIKAANCVAFRTHTQPWREIWYEVADEEGLLMVHEGAIWNDDRAYRINDPEFWDNYAAHLKAMVDRDKNKPSVVMYSLENEMHGGRMNDQAPARKDLARMGRLMHKWDPTRPIYYESDGDPMGVADAIGVHYPHEYPDYTKWPNTAYWMDEPQREPAARMFTEGKETWKWNRQKPVYLGEFLWVPERNPAAHTVFFGDQAYTNPGKYRTLGKAMSWKMAIQAYRYYEVGGICPWTMGEGGPLNEQENELYAAQKYAMQPVAAYIREYDHNLYSGQRVERTADVYNDVLEDSELTVHWALLDEGQEVDAGSRKPNMSPGERRKLNLSLHMPKVTSRLDITLRLRITREGKQVFTDEKTYTVFPPLELQGPANCRLALYDPAGELAEGLRRHGVEFEVVEDIGALPENADVLIVGPEALPGEETGMPIIGEERRSGLVDFVRRGGRVLALYQKQASQDWLPASLTDHASTMTFPQMPRHPVLSGLRAEDLKWWRPDNLVSAAEPVRPSARGFKAILTSGSAAGLEHAPLLEVPLGRGTFVMAQMRIVERLGVEPAAGILLQNALEYLADFRPSVKKTALYCPDETTRKYLKGRGLNFSDITDAPEDADLQETGLLVACGPLEGLRNAAGDIRGLLDRGGALLLHGVTKSNLEKVQPIIGRKLSGCPYRGHVRKVPGAHELSDYISNEDLYWTQHKVLARRWQRQPLAPNAAECIVSYRAEAGQKITTVPHTDMELAHIGKHRSGYASMPSSASTATFEVKVPRDGLYVVQVTAGGSPAEGEWPRARVKVDGKRFGAFTCTGGEMNDYPMTGRLTKGTHEVVIRFANDLNTATEDRNLYVKEAAISAVPEDGGLTFLTSPPALAVLEAGNGRVVIDNIDWENADKNGTRAARYVCSLLTGLGADIGPRKAGVRVEVEDFEARPNMAHFRRTSRAAYMGSSGWVKGKVRCARAGRYTFRIVARGTPVDGIHPRIKVNVDGRNVGTVQLDSSGWKEYPVGVRLEEGMSEIELTFTNDEYRPEEGEDRNLWIDRIEVF